MPELLVGCQILLCPLCPQKGCIEQGLNRPGLQNRGVDRAVVPGRGREPSVAPDDLEAHSSDGLVEQDALSGVEVDEVRRVLIWIGIGKHHAADWMRRTNPDVKKGGTFFGVVAVIEGRDLARTGPRPQRRRPTKRLSPGSSSSA